MPYTTEWQPNELLLEHKGVRIFHTYRNDEDEQRTYWFGTASDTSDEEEETNFDVRDLPTWESHEPRNQPDDSRSEEDAIRAAIIAAIDVGYLDEYIQAAEDRPKEVPITSIK